MNSSALRVTLFAAPALAALTSICSCNSPPKGPTDVAKVTPKGLTDMLNTLAPRFRVKAPVGGNASLGYRLVAGKPESNPCFGGELADDAPSGGWTHIETSYDLESSGNLSVDFSSLVQIPLSVGTGVGGGTHIGLVLGDVREHKLKNLFYKVDGNCADSSAKDSVKYANVLTSALKANSLEITGEDSIVANAKVEVAKIGAAETGASTSGKRKWTAKELFFAEFPECVEVTITNNTCNDKAVGAGNVCDLSTCSFQVELFDSQRSTWKGTLSCQGGSKTEYSASLGSWQAANKVEPGVSYNLRVLQGKGAGSVTIEMKRWSVGTVAPTQCKGVQ